MHGCISESPGVFALYGVCDNALVSRMKCVMCNKCVVGMGWHVRVWVDVPALIGGSAHLGGSSFSLGIARGQQPATAGTGIRTRTCTDTDMGGHIRTRTDTDTDTESAFVQQQGLHQELLPRPPRLHSLPHGGHESIELLLRCLFLGQQRLALALLGIEQGL